MELPNLHKKARMSPKDFFLYVGAMIALYVSVVSVLVLLFQYINVWFPDELDFRPSYDAQIRFAIASLIIIFPLYVFLTRLLNQDIRRNPEKKDLWVRKWLIYLTLFAGAITLIIDLVVLVNAFLEGEVTMRFALKVIAIFIVIGGAFLYYFFDLKGRWEKKEKQSVTIGWLIGFLVLVILVGGFFIIGSPKEARLVRFDEEKIRDLESIQSQIVNFWQEKEVLPEELANLEDPLVGYRLPKDPQTQEDYTYRATGELSFELCADFNLELSEDDVRAAPRVYPVEFFPKGSWEHEAGVACFSRTIDPDKFPPRKETL